MVHKNRFIVDCVFDTWNEKVELINILSSLGAGSIRVETPLEWRTRIDEEEEKKCQDNID